MLQKIHNRDSFLSSQQDPILFNSIELDPDRAYFIYVGEIKAYGLNPFLIPVLEQIYRRSGGLHCHCAGRSGQLSVFQPGGVEQRIIPVPLQHGVTG